MNPFAINTISGFGEVKFGMTRDEIKRFLGEPDEEEIQEFNQTQKTAYLEYFDLGVSLAFASEDQFLLGMITFYDERYLIGNQSYIGKNQQELFEMAENAGIDDLMLDSEMTTEENEAYYSEKYGLTFILIEDLVDHIILLSETDEEGNPIWPK